jgi:glycosyltransferase involved in cell wall biosynthesis
VPDAAAREEAVLCAAAAVLTTSRWTRDRLLARYPLEPDAVQVAQPGADLAPLAPGTADGTALLSVAAVAAHKGSDILVAALADLTDLDWQATWVGALDREPEFAARVQRQATAAGIGTRLLFAGPRTGPALAASYARADVLVHPSRGESYGMVVAEALAHGLPVIASDVGGIREALGSTPEGRSPGLLVRPDSPDALTAALRSWLGEPELRAQLRAAALQRRDTLRSWTQTASRVAGVLAGLT